MMQTFIPACYEAFTLLLARPDPGDLAEVSSADTLIMRE
jgi:hypothetical protein